MGADFIGALVWLPKDEKPDWEVGRQTIQKLASTPMPNWPDEFVEFWADGPDQDPNGPAAMLKQDLECLQDHWDNGGRESAMVQILGVNMLLTGGMSWGDAPTDLMDCIDRLREADVLQACGFNRDLPDGGLSRPNELADVLREFVEDVKLAYGTGGGDEIDEEMMDWPDLAVTYRKAASLLRGLEEGETR